MPEEVAVSARAEHLARLLREARRAVVLTGAGVSVPSGIPDFRTPGTGLWENVDPMEVAHIDAWRRDPDRFWSFYGDRFATLVDREPNEAHLAIAELEARGLVRAVITQNIDRLHRVAGSERLIEVHGSIQWSVCMECGARVSLERVLHQLRADSGAPLCSACVAPLKPDVVLFGELLPERAMAEAQELALSADLMICVGSSLEVYPVAGLPAMTRGGGGRIALVTQGPTPYDDEAEVKLDGDVVEEMRALLAALGVNRTVIAVLVGLIAVLAAVGMATGGEEEDESTTGAEAPPASDERNVREVARGVERVRQLEFDGLPEVRRVSAQEAARIALREIDAGLPEGMLESEQRLLTLLGLLPEGADLREVLSDAVSSEVGGLYVPSEKTMYLVEGVGGGLLGNVLLAHELTHALEDQHFGLGPGPMRGLWRDRAVADGAVQEGTATVAMVDYVALAQGGEADLDPAVRERALDALDDVALPNSAGLPRYMAESLLFPYVAGARLVNRVEGNADWGAVDAMFEDDGPVSSEQVMHPGRYERGERPVRVRLPGMGAPMPDGSERIFEGDIGEWETEQFLREANGEERSRPAAAGWGGAAFELWETPGGDVLALRWELDTPRDARELLAAARRSADALSAEGAVVAAGPRGVAVGLAPEAQLARDVARRAAQAH